MLPTHSSKSPSLAYKCSNQDINHSSRGHTSKDYEYNSEYLSNDEHEKPQTKRQKLQPQQIDLLSPISHYQESTTSISQIKKKCKSAPNNQTQPRNTANLSQEQIESLKSLKFSLREFIDLYNSIPVHARRKQFYITCKEYVYELSKTKSTFNEKKEIFVALPQTLRTTMPLFKSIFEQEHLLLTDIIKGKTPSTNLKKDIKTLMQLLPPAYLKKQIRQYIKQKCHLSQEDKAIIASCRKQLGDEEKRLSTSQTQSEKTPPTEENISSDEEQTTNKQKLPTEANIILDSLQNKTIDANDIVAHRIRLILLKVDKTVIANAFRAFRRYITASSRPDKNYILQQLTEAGKQTAKMKSEHIFSNDRLKHLYDQALSGTLSLTLVGELRSLLLKEFPSAKAASSLLYAKKSLIKHNKAQTKYIKETFEIACKKQLDVSAVYKNLQEKIEGKNLQLTEFTSIYESIPQKEKTNTFNKMCNKYIRNTLNKTKLHTDKISILKNLPCSLQKSPLIIKMAFPRESKIISSIKNGHINSNNIKQHFPRLLQIINRQHLLYLIKKYVTSKKTLSLTEKADVLACKNAIKQLNDCYPPKEHTSKTTKKNRKKTGSPSSQLKQYSDLDNTEQKLNKRAKKTLQSTNNDIIITTPTVTKKCINEQPILNTQESTCTCPTSPQPSTSYSIASISKIVRPFSMEQTPSNAPTYILQKNEGEDIEDNITLNYILELAQDMQQEYPVEQSSFQPVEETSTSPSYTFTDQISFLEQIPLDELTHILQSICNEDSNHIQQQRLPQPTSLTITGEHINEQSTTNTQTQTLIEQTSSLEQIPLDELTHILQSICNEDSNHIQQQCLPQPTSLTITGKHINEQSTTNTQTQTLTEQTYSLEQIPYEIVPSTSQPTEKAHISQPHTHT